MSSLAPALQTRRLAAESAAWALLRADNAPVIVAVLGRHLGGEERRLPAPVLAERVEEDLADLRSDFPELTRTAVGYLTAWREQGFLVRRVVPGYREETLELSDAALAALAFIASLGEDRQAVTASRLETILERVHALNVATDPRVETRLAALEAQRAELDREIDRVRSGRFEVLAAADAVERAADILALAAALPADFARVRRQIEEINQSLVRRLVEDQDSRGRVLEEIFAGIDQLEESEAGRSFDGFHALVSDPERSGRFDDDVEAILEREFAERLPADQAHALRRMLPTLQDTSREVRDVMTSLGRSLRRFVQSEEHGRARRVHQLLQGAAGAALAASDKARLLDPTGFRLDQTSVATAAIGELSLRDPSTSRSLEPLEEAPSLPADLDALAALARESDIDFRELRESVAAAVRARGACTIAEVLEDRPATQGLASVIGLLVLALKHGSVGDGVETVRWETAGGQRRRGTVPVCLFEEEL
ncbi:MAG: DUF3375 domain-containing protein [Bifidobacteriaceae bacterium]|jgi:hypothetical protein|nr:DUF3375 domain-containing protein [Bifidobacteriaceae bacterium]